MTQMFTTFSMCLACRAVGGRGKDEIGCDFLGHPGQRVISRVSGMGDHLPLVLALILRFIEGSLRVGGS